MTYPSHRIHVTGKHACFTRPELKAERVSYPLITPSAARGIFEAILWKPAIRWQIDKIELHAPIKWTAMRRNEVSSRASIPSQTLMERGGIAPQLLADSERAQRNTVCLADVAYILHAHFEMTEQAGPSDNPGKFADMFERRLTNGQQFSQPYLGCREFIADVAPVMELTPSPVDETRDLGLMLYDIAYGADRRHRPLFFHAQLDRGVVNVPSLESVLAEQSRGGAA